MRLGEKSSTFVFPEGENIFEAIVSASWPLTLIIATPPVAGAVDIAAMLELNIILVRLLPDYYI